MEDTFSKTREGEGERERESGDERGRFVIS